MAKWKQDGDLEEICKEWDEKGVPQSAFKLQTTVISTQARRIAELEKQVLKWQKLASNQGREIEELKILAENEGIPLERYGFSPSNCERRLQEEHDERHKDE